MNKDYDGQTKRSFERLRDSRSLHSDEIDFSRIPDFINRQIKELFPINQVPEELASALRLLDDHFKKSDYLLDETLDLLIQYLSNAEN